MKKSVSHAEEGEEAEGWLISYADMMTLLVGFFVILLSFSKVDEEKMEEVKAAASKEFGGIYEIPFADLANQLRTTLEQQGLGRQFEIKQTPLGVNISFYGAVLFAPGSADIRPEGASLLEKLMPTIKQMAPGFKIVVEGHTDDVPVSPMGSYRTNWELSGLRAGRVIENFESAGFDKTKLTAVGYGEARPLVPNRDSDNVPIESNRAQNRRVVIKLIEPSAKVLEGSE